MDRSLRPIPRATYRLQFNKGFTFDDARRLAPYLAKLGISHVYASPYLKAQPGSSHGYDVVDHTELNAELGTPEDFEKMCAAFSQNGLGQILDFVPNHVGVAGATNRWWLDVLEWGPKSPFASWFDIDWASDRSEGKVLLPILGDHYRTVLDAGDLEIRFDCETGAIAVWAYGTHKLPINPLQYRELLQEAATEDIVALPHAAREQAGKLKRGLAQRRDAHAEIKRRLSSLSRELIDDLIQQQHWKLAHFRAAADDLNYRRFFNISELAGLRMEEPEVFKHAHALVFRLIEDGKLDGLRLDHIDGLYDPKAYCRQLRAEAPRPIYLLVEKILAANEHLRSEWGVDGTTGYEFANLVGGLLIDRKGEKGLTQFYEEFTGYAENFEDTARAAKLYIMEHELAAELDRLAKQLHGIMREAPYFADFSLNAVRRTLQQVIASFAVYRSYVDADGRSPEDLRRIAAAVADARQRNPLLEAKLFDVLRDVLCEDPEALSFVMRLQQYTGPVMAKGLEDTAFYRYTRLLALNEVGGEPGHFGIACEAFHRANRERAQHWPHCMLATATHDTKRGEDGRARLAVLSEMPQRWALQVRMWSGILREATDGPESPSRNDEYAFYQLLLSAWPAELSDGAVPDPMALSDLQERLELAMTKSMREAKLNSSWASPNIAYEHAMMQFIAKAFEPTRPNRFLEAFVSFQHDIARFGVQNSLIQTVFKLTAPGVPDLYQGSELWNFDLVDPDNRRPVDFARRIESLAAFEQRHAKFTELLRNWRDGKIKLFLTRILLELRQAHPALFASGAYIPLYAQGEQPERVCGFARVHENLSVVAAGLLFPSQALRGEAETATVLPLPQTQPRGWKNILDGSILAPSAGSVTIGQLFQSSPIAVLIPA